MKLRIGILLLLIFLTACSSRAKKEDPLLLPPGYGEMPDAEETKNNGNATPKKSDQDLQELRELLLKN